MQWFEDAVAIVTGGGMGLGAALCEELASRGATVVVADASHADEIAPVIAGHDVVVSSVTDRTGPDRSIIPTVAAALIEAVPQAGVARLAVMGGGGSLLAPDGRRILDQDGFPDAHKTEARRSRSTGPT